jgi:uncharacterized protein
MRIRRVAGSLAAWIAIACCIACAVAPRPRPDEVRVRVASVGFDTVAQSPVVVLVEEGGPRGLPIWVGGYEARSIALALAQVPAPRPNPHDLLASVLQQLDARLVSVVITELRDDTYYAVLSVEHDGRVQRIDARPSDAIAIALRTATPLYARSTVMDVKQDTTPDKSAALRGSVRRPPAWR